ncbi:MAG: ATP-binding protein [Anaerolineae bacterium]
MAEIEEHIQTLVSNMNELEVILSQDELSVEALDEARANWEDIEVVFFSSVDNALQNEHQELTQHQEHFEAAKRNAEIVSIGLGLVGLMVSVGAVLFISHSITTPITGLKESAEGLGAGKLDLRAKVHSNDEIGQLAQSFNSMASAISNRDNNLKLVSDVSKQLNTELDLNKLLSEIAEITAKAFNMYYVSIFLYRDNKLKLRKGTGDAGSWMVDAGLEFGTNDRGVVPFAARSLAPAVFNDVREDPHYLPNPFLPDTKSELAIPVLFMGQLVGVLDIQAQETNRFKPEDIQTLLALAEQIAVAVRNAQLFDEAKTARENAEQADHVKSAFLASMSHELRTPLNSVINYTKFVIKGVMGPVTDKQVETLTKVADSGRHLLNLINDVLDISKIESGALSLFIEDNVDMAEILRSVASTAESLLEGKPIAVQLDVPPTLPMIKGDKQRLRQILLNILSNACKFTEEGHIKIGANVQNGEILLAIEDTGPGIRSEDRAAVFEPFKQTDTGLRQGKGTGLGMPISKSLAEAHGGRLWFKSTPGTGTTFYVALPVKSELLIPTIA